MKIRVEIPFLYRFRNTSRQGLLSLLAFCSADSLRAAFHLQTQTPRRSHAFLQLPDPRNQSRTPSQTCILSVSGSTDRALPMDDRFSELENFFAHPWHSLSVAAAHHLYSRSNCHATTDAEKGKRHPVLAFPNRLRSRICPFRKMDRDLHTAHID